MLHISCLSKLCTKELSSCSAYSHGENSISLPWIDNVSNNMFRSCKQLYVLRITVRDFQYWVLSAFYLMKGRTFYLFIIFLNVRFWNCVILKVRRNMSLVYTHKIYCLNIFFDILLTVHLNIFILILTYLMHYIL